ncbi:uncharacterized protein LOC116308750 [Actinia tenebrosa]|uniref:Uncharacterized protein LOC116308750 n=1 Tax=Actinia tenebrosa TaxID=6105 RepID=A0A6P8J5U3_ACTTE|nr:uncharacterized protein LOC116308750 [Actinia tenebrosa]
MYEFILHTSSNQLYHWTGFGRFFQFLEFSTIYTYPEVYELLYNTRATVISLPAVIWDCLNKRTFKFLLLGGIRLLKDASRKISCFRFFCSWRKSVPPCVVIIFFYFWLKRQQYCRKFAILSKESDQSRVNNNIKDIEKHILSRLQQDLRNEHIQLEEKSWIQDLDDGERPVFVFCVISSRIGTDIENAMRGVHDNSPVILVLLHCALSILLRDRDLFDDEELLDPTMKNRMTGIAHFAFSDREGLYDCKQNRYGFKKLGCTINVLLS